MDDKQLYIETKSPKQHISNIPAPEVASLDFLTNEFDGKNYSIFFIMKENYIKIEGKGIYDQPNKKYVNDLSINDWKKLDYLSSFRSLDEIFNKLSTMNNNDFYIIEKDEFSITLKIKFSDEYKVYPMKVILEDIKTFKSKYSVINKIDEENKVLKNDKKELEERVKILEDYINKLKFSLPFNFFDDSLYVLEKVYNNLDSFDLISKREYLGLINSGIKNLFKKNITDCKLVYKFDKNQNNPSYLIYTKCQKINNELIIIKTMNQRTFGFFHQKQNFYGVAAGINMQSACCSGNTGSAGSLNYGFGAGGACVNLGAGYAEATQSTCANYGHEKDIVSQNIIFPYKFDSSLLKIKNSFVFSFDNSKIYYSDINHNSDESPNFAFKYDYQRKYFSGKEFSKYNQTTEVNSPIQTTTNNQYAPNYNNQSLAQYKISTSIQGVKGTENQMCMKENLAYSTEPTNVYSNTFTTTTTTSTAYSPLGLPNNNLDNKGLPNNNIDNNKYSYYLNGKEEFVIYELEVFQINF